MDRLRAAGDGLCRARVGHPAPTIDIVVLSHLHFDHAGGLLTAWQEGEPPKLAFPKAQVVVGHEAWQRAKAPHARDRASFVPALHALLEESGRLDVVKGATSDLLGNRYSFSYSDGHTPGLMLTRVEEFGGSMENRQWPLAVMAALGVFGIMAAAILSTSKPVKVEATHTGFRELGDSLFTQWAIPFEIASVLLLVALIGAIVIARAGGQE